MSGPIGIKTPFKSPGSPGAAAGLQAGQARLRSEVYLFLARAFMYPLEPLDAFHRRACAALIALGVSDTPLHALGPPTRDRLEESFRATFTHTTPAEFPPYETQYGQGNVFRQPHALAELAALYRAFGLQPASGERLDHIGTELEFMYYLCYKEAYALLSHNEEGAQRCREGEKHFLEQHLGRWAPLFLERLSAHREGFYAPLASLTGTWLAQEAKRLEAWSSPLAETDLLAAQRLESSLEELHQIPAVCEGA